MVLHIHFLEKSVAKRCKMKWMTKKVQNEMDVPKYTNTNSNYKVTLTRQW
jgi:hypothetical protein